MSVLHLRSSSGLYGAENMLLGLLPELGSLGVATRLLCINNPLQQSQALHEVARNAGLDGALLPCAGRFDWTTVRAISREISRSLQSGQPTVLHAHDYKSLFYALLARRGRGIPLIATSHGHFAADLRLAAYNRLERLMMRRASKVVIVSEAMRHQLADGGIEPSRIVLIENGIDTHRFRPDAPAVARAAMGIAEDAFVFGTAMRLGDEKNPIGLVDAFAEVASRHPAAVLLIAGDGPRRAEVQAAVERTCLQDRVRLLGARLDLPALYPVMDCFVLPSLSEGLPLSLLEAMASAVPVIATRVGHVPIVLEGLPVSVIAPGHVDALVSAMEASLLQPRRRIDALRQRVQSLYSAERMATRHLAAYGLASPDDAVLPLAVAVLPRTGAPGKTTAPHGTSRDRLHQDGRRA